MPKTAEAIRYATYAKPWFAPPDWIFGPVWTILYLMIAWASIQIIWKVRVGELPAWILGLLAVNIIANIAFTPIQFGLNNLWLAWVDILVVLGSLAVIEYMMWQQARAVFWMLLPYLLWVAFATVLQTSIVMLNK